MNSTLGQLREGFTKEGSFGSKLRQLAERFQLCSRLLEGPVCRASYQERGHR